MWGLLFPRDYDGETREPRFLCSREGKDRRSVLSLLWGWLKKREQQQFWTVLCWTLENNFRVHCKARFQLKLIFAALHLQEFFLNFNIHREMHWRPGVLMKRCQPSYCTEVLAAVSETEVLAMSSVNLKYHTVASTRFVHLSSWTYDMWWWGKQVLSCLLLESSASRDFFWTSWVSISWRRKKLLLEAASCNVKGLLQWAKCKCF